MGKPYNSLTDNEVKNAQPKAVMYKLNDGGGLWLHVEKTGVKRWIFRYWIGGHESSLAFGVYPRVKLAHARAARDQARGLIAAGKDPAAERRQARAATVQAREQAKQERQADLQTFEVCVREWFEKYYSALVSPAVCADTLYRMERDLFPWLGQLPIQQVDEAAIRAALSRVRDRGAVEQARRHLQVVTRIFRYARSSGWVSHNPCSDLRGFIPPIKSAGFKAETDPRALGPMLRAMDTYPGTFVVRMALRFLPLVFLRPGELRQLEWSHLAASELRVPSVLLKKKEAPWHIVPLSRQALAVLAELQPLTGHGRFIFPGRDDSRPMSMNTLRQALRSMGFDATPHGFRKSASTLLNEQGFRPDAVERQLAHMERDEVRAAYNYAEHLPERREMMQAWADYLDDLKKNCS